MAWTKKHGEILRTFFQRLDSEGIKFFIIRNFKGLPDENQSKDVDIILKYGTAKKTEKILKEVFKSFDLEYYYMVRIEESMLCRGVNQDTDFAIHIDLMNGYINRGVELFSFEELYKQTEPYNGFRVLNELYNGVMLFVYKQFGYKKPYLKSEYRKDIFNIWEKYPEFSVIIGNLIGQDLYKKVEDCIKVKDFDKMLSYTPLVNRRLRAYSNKKNLIKNTYRNLKFWVQKTDRVIFRYRKYEKSISVMAPDGTGKTTFLEGLLEKLAFIYVDAPKDISRFNVYHSRPTILPNLGAVGEKAGVMKQDKDFTNPHRAKPANFVSSFIRITYYWLDYVIGYCIYTRKDVLKDFYTVYDRYSFDLIVDPGRTRIKLPQWIRCIFVKLMPHPKLNFFLKANPDVIIKRKRELTLDEISRQVGVYSNLTKYFNIITINANESVDEMVDIALKDILNQYWEKL